MQRRDQLLISTAWRGAMLECSSLWPEGGDHPRSFRLSLAPSVPLRSTLKGPLRVPRAAAWALPVAVIAVPNGPVGCPSSGDGSRSRTGDRDNAPQHSIASRLDSGSDSSGSSPPSLAKSRRLKQMRKRASPAIDPDQQQATSKNSLFPIGSDSDSRMLNRRGSLGDGPAGIF